MKHFMDTFKKATVLVLATIMATTSLGVTPSSLVSGASIELIDLEDSYYDTQDQVVIDTTQETCEQVPAEQTESSYEQTWEDPYAGYSPEPAAQPVQEYGYATMVLSYIYGYSPEGAIYNIHYVGNDWKAGDWTGYSFIVNYDGIGYLTGTDYRQQENPAELGYIYNAVENKYYGLDSVYYNEEDEYFYYPSETWYATLAPGYYVMKQYKAPDQYYEANEGEYVFCIANNETTALDRQATEILNGQLKAEFLPQEQTEPVNEEPQEEPVYEQPAEEEQQPTFNYPEMTEEVQETEETGQEEQPETDSVQQEIPVGDEGQGLDTNDQAEPAQAETGEVYFQTTDEQQAEPEQEEIVSSETEQNDVEIINEEDIEEDTEGEDKEAPADEYTDTVSENTEYQISETTENGTEEIIGTQAEDGKDLSMEPEETKGMGDADTVDDAADENAETADEIAEEKEAEATDDTATEEGPETVVDENEKIVEENVNEDVKAADKDADDEEAIVGSKNTDENEISNENVDDTEPETGNETAEENAEVTEEDIDDEAAEIKYPAFQQAKTVTGVVVVVTAEEGVFPEGCSLSVTKVTWEEQDAIDTMVDEARNEARNVAASYTFDIKVLDGEGNEIQPKDGQKVYVSFRTEEAANQNLDAQVYHIDEEAGEAEELNIDTESYEDVIVAETDGFSYYTVEFTYGTLQYVMHGEETVALQEILDAVGLEGAVEDVSVSDASLFAAGTYEGVWYVQSFTAFSSEEWMIVTIDGVEYRIIVTDAVGAAYAVLTADGNLIFFRSTEEYTNGDETTVTDTENNTYTGRVFTGFEQTAASSASSVPWYGYRNSITSVSVAGSQTITPVNTRYWFYNCINLTSADLTGIDTTNDTSMSGMFYGCESLASIDVSTWNTYNVTDMYQMFDGCSSLQTLNLGNFNTANVTSMSKMFNNCESLASLDISGFDTSRVTRMYQMFKNCYGLTSLNLSHFQTASVTSVSDMFYGCENLESLNISGFDTSAVTNFSGMFSNCYKLSEITLGTGFDFDGNGIASASYKANLPGLSWTRNDQAYGPYTAEQMITEYTAEMAGTWVGSSTAYAYYSNGELVFFRSANTYSNNSSKTAVDINGNVYSGGVVFTGIETTIVSSFNSTPWTSYRSYITSIRVADNQTIAPISTQYWFWDFSLLTDCDLTGLDTSNVRRMEYMFGNCSSLESLDLGSPDTSRVTTMSNMFSGCSSLESLNLSGFDTSSVTTMSNMFRDCTSLTSLDISSFDTGSVTTMNNMFRNCASLTSLDLSGFDTSSATDMCDMFYYCNALTAITLSPDFSFKGNGSITNTYYMAILPSTHTWVREDEAYGPYTATELRNNYTSEMAGTWIDPLIPTAYAVLTEEGELIFFQTLNKYGVYDGTNTQTTVTDINGNSYTGIVFYPSGDGADQIHNLNNYFSHAVTSARVAEGQTITFITFTSDLAMMFNGFDHLVTADLRGFETSGLYSFSSMFEDCSALTSVDLSTFDTRDAYDMSNMFDGCTSLQEVVLGENFDFYGNGENPRNYGILPDDGRLWNREGGVYGPYTATELRNNYTSEMAGTWCRYPYLYAVLTDGGELILFQSNDVYDQYDVRTVTDTNGNSYTGTVFTTGNYPRWISYPYAEQITSVRVAEGQTIKPVSTADWFNGCTNLTDCDLTGLDTSAVTSMGSMFEGCSSLTNLDLSGFDTGSVTNMNGMFDGCSSLTSLDISSFDTGSVTAMSAMFDGCSSLTSLDISSFDTGSVTDMQYMFRDCTSLAQINLGPDFSFKGNDITNTGYMAVLPDTNTWTREDKAYGPYTATELRNSYTSDMAGVWELTDTAYAVLTDDHKLILFRSRNSYSAGSQTVTDIMGNTYTGFVFTGIETSNPSSKGEVPWNTTAYIGSVRIAEGQTIKPVSTAYWFYERGIINCDLTGLDTSAVTNMSYMFYGCRSLRNLDLSGLDTSSATDMNHMFQDCTQLESLDLSSFDTGSVTDMGFMFYNCTSLTQVTLGPDFSFRGNGITNINKMSILPSDNGRWKRSDDAFGPYPAIALRDVYNASMAGTWVTDQQTGYAILTDNGELIFFQSPNTYTESSTSVIDSMGNTYTGHVFTGIETTTYASASDVPWDSYRTSITSVRVAEGQTVAPIDTEYWFSNCSNLTDCDLTGLDTSAVTYMNYMFSGCSGLTNLDMSGFDTSHVKNMSGMFNGCFHLSRLDLSGFDTSAVTSMSTMFRECQNLINLDISGFDTSAVTSMYYMFYNCKSLSQVVLGPDFSFKGNDITNTSSMAIFPETKTWTREDGAYGPYTSAELRENYTSDMAGVWSVPSTAYAILTNEGELIFFRSGKTYTATANQTVTDIKGNTYTGRVFTGIETTDYQTYSSVQWYNYRTSITSVRVAEGQTIKPINTGTLFYGCTNLTDCDLTGLDTSAVTCMESMFYICSSLTNLNLSGFDTSSVTDMGFMFDGCRSLTSLDLSSFDTGNVTNMQYMFYNCKNITSLDLSGFDTSAVTSMSYIFYGCSSLESLDISSFDTGSVTSLGSDSMFNDCTSLIRVVLGPDFSFKASGLPSEHKWIREDGAYGPYTANELHNNYTADMAGVWCGVSAAYAILTNDGELIFFRSYNNYQSNGTNQTVTDIAGNTYTGRVFRNIETANYASYNNVPWYGYRENITSVRVADNQTISPISTGHWFYFCTALTDCDLTGLDTSAVTTMNGMFEDCRSLVSLDLSGFDTGNVTTMSGMFRNCYSLTSLALSNFDTSSVTNMNYMFSGCYGLISLDISGFNTGNVTSMSSMFSDCNTLTEITLSPDFSFKGNGITSTNIMAVLPSINGEWVRDDGVYGPYTAIVLRNSYTSDMEGRWITLSGSAYAVLTNDGELIFFRSNENYTDNVYQTVTDIEGNTYRGRVFTNVEYTGDAPPWSPYWQEITSVRVAENQIIAPYTTEYWFDGCENLTSTDFSGLDTNRVEYMDFMFFDCSSLTSLDLSSFNTESVRSMYGLFNNCPLEEIILGPNFSFIDESNPCLSDEESTWTRDDGAYGPYTANELCSNYTADMAGRWLLNSKAYAIITDDGEMILFRSRDHYSVDEYGNTWQTMTDVEGNTYEGSIYPVSETNEYVDDPGEIPWIGTTDGYSDIISVRVAENQTIKPKSTDYWFYNCNYLTSVDLSGLDTSSVTSMHSMFSDCSSLESLDLSGFDTGSVTDVYGMFSGCNSLESLDLSSFDTGSVTNMQHMFYNCSSLESLDISSFDTGSVTRMSSMFDGCSNLTSLDLSSFDTGKVTNMSNMFDNCSSLESLDLGSFDTGKVTNMTHMFRNCNSLMGIALGENTKLKSSVSLKEATWRQDSTGDYVSTSDILSMYSNPTQADYFGIESTFMFHANGGTFDDAKVIHTVRTGHKSSYIIGTDIELTEDVPHKEGYTFAGWSYAGTILQDGDEIPEAICYASWTPYTYTVVFNPNGGEGEPLTIEATYNEPVPMPGNLFQKEEYVLTSWNTQRNGLGTSYHADESLYNLTDQDGETVYLYAQWTSEDNFATVRFRTNCDTEIEDKVLIKGSALGMVTEPEKEDYTFTAWHKNSLRGPVVTEETVINEDMTLVAEWVKDPVITFNVDGQIVDDYTKTVKYNTNIGKLPVPDSGMSCKTFSGWYTAETGGEKVDKTTVMTEDTTLYAKWQWGLIFDPAGGQFVEWPYYEAQNDPVFTIDSLPVVTKKGYSFDGWYLDDGVTRVEIGDTVDLENDSYGLTAHWTVSTLALVTIDPNGGDFANGNGYPVTITLSAGDTLQGIQNISITRPGYDFAGWLGSDGEYYVGGETINESLTLTAQWVEKDCTLTFMDSESGEAQYNTIEVAYGSTLNQLPGAMPYNYNEILDGWYTEEDGQGTKLTTDTVITEDATYYPYFRYIIQEDDTGDAVYSYGAYWENGYDASTVNIDNNLIFTFTQDGTAIARLHVWFEIDQVEEDWEPYQPGAIKIDIPKYVWEDWDGNPAGTCNIDEVLAEYPEDSWMDFSYIDNGDHYTLINNCELYDNFGFEATIEYTVSCKDVPGGAIDTNDNFVDGYDFYDEDVPVLFAIDQDLDDVNEKEHPVTLHTEMHTGVSCAPNKECLVNKDDDKIYYYKEWDPVWGDMPSGAGNYFFAIWSVKMSEGAAAQDYTVTCTDEPLQGSIIKWSDSDDMSTAMTPMTSENPEKFVLIAYPNTLIQNLPEGGISLKNDVYMTCTTRSGYVTEGIATGYFTIVPDPDDGEPDRENSVDKRRSDDLTVAGGQNVIATDNDTLTLGWDLEYDANAASGINITDTNEYTTEEHVIQITDGVHGDIMYNSGTATYPFVWEPGTGNVALSDADYMMKSLDVDITEYIAITDEENVLGIKSTQDEGMEDREEYGTLKVYVRYMNDNNFTLYRTINMSNPTYSVTFPEYVAGWRIQYITSAYRTHIEIHQDVELQPEQHLKNLLISDLITDASSVIKNTALFEAWKTSDTTQTPEFMATVYKGGNNTAVEQCYELTGRTISQYTHKTSGAAVSNISLGTQDVPMYIEGHNYVNGGNATTIAPLTSGAFYDLLPPGTSVDPDTVYGVPTTANTTSVTGSAGNYNINDAARLDQTLYDVTFVENWQNSGRTMMIIRFSIPSTANAPGIGFWYKLHTTYASVLEKGTSAYNDVAFVNLSPRNIVLSRSGTISSVSNQTYYQSLEEEYAPYISYASRPISFNRVTAFSWGFHKYVQTGTDYLKNGNTYPNGEYHWILHFSQSTSSTAKEIVLYDVLESGFNASVYGDPVFMESDWYGELQYVDVSGVAKQLTKGSSYLKCAPVVYYSTKARDEFTSDDLNVDNAEVWTTEMPADKSTITAIAVDCRKCTDGTDFILDGNKAMEVKLVMKAPDDPEAYGKYAYNPSVISKLSEEEGGGGGGRGRANVPTTLTANAYIRLVNNDPVIHKESDPESGTAEEPTVVFEDQSINYTLTVTNTGDEFALNNIVAEDTIPTGLWINKNGITAAFGNDTPVTIDNTPRVSLTRSGQDLTFNITTLSPGETVTIVVPTVVRVTGIRYVNQAFITSVNDLERNIESEITYHESEEPEDEYELTIRKVNGDGDLIGGARLRITGRSIYDTEDIAPIYWNTEDDEQKVLTLKPGTYTLHEVGVPSGYLQADDITIYLTEDATITMFDPESRPLSIKKFWNDGNGERPESIMAALYKNGAFYKNVSLTRTYNSETGEYEWTADVEVPDTDINGTPYTYTIVEELSGYVTSVDYPDDSHINITNTKTGNVEGTKTWADDNNSGLTRPSSITVKLYRNDVLYRTTTTNSAQNWKYKFSDVPLYDADGVAYSYKVLEDPVDGYTTSYESQDTNGLAVTVQCGYGNSRYNANYYLYYYYNGTLYKVTLSANTTSYTQTVSIPATEFWVEYNNKTDAVSKYGIRVTNVSPLAAIPSVSHYTGSFTSGATVIDVDDWSEMESEHNVLTDISVRRWHYNSNAISGVANNNITNTIIPEDSTHIRIRKVDQNGDVVTGAKLQLLDSEETVVLEWFSEDHAVLFDGIEPGTYTLHEVFAPDTTGEDYTYQTASDMEIEILDTEELQTFTMIDPKTYDNQFTLHKVDENGDPIEGVKFRIEIVLPETNSDPGQNGEPDTGGNGG